MCFCVNLSFLLLFLFIFFFSSGAGHILFSGLVSAITFITLSLVPRHGCRRRRSRRCRRCCGCPSLSQFHSKDSSKKNQARIKQESSKIKTQESSKNQARSKQEANKTRVKIVVVVFVCLFVCSTLWREATSLNKR